jgi:hypothetical protein
VLSNQLQLSAQQIETRLAVGDDDLCQVVNQSIAAHADGAERGLSMRDSMVAAGLLLAAVLIGASAGYWIGQSAKPHGSSRSGDGRRGSDRSRHRVRGDHAQHRSVRPERVTRRPGSCYSCANALPSRTMFDRPERAVSADLALLRRCGETFHCRPSSVMTVTVFLL